VPPALSVWRAGTVAFLASGATLVLELVAGRMLAPFVGVSLYTWTAIIGVVLAGISLGSWLGGRLADRRPAPRLLGGLFVLSGLSSLATLGIVTLLGDGALLRPLPLLARIFVLTTFLFLPPSLLLGMVMPLVIRLALPDLRSTGQVVGIVYGFGTAGSLVGNFATGFVLTAYLSVNVIIVAVSLALLGVGCWALGVGHRATGAGSRATGREPELPPQHPTPNTQHPTPRSVLSLAGNVRLASAIVVVSSFCTMAIELAASRILAPTVGLSLYSWTVIIGTVLAAMTTGHFVGGRIADRWPSQRVLGLSLFAGGLASLGILASMVVLDAGGLFSGLGLVGRIVALTAVIFFLPVFLLGTISPQVVRLAVTDLRRAGRVAGQVYAWSTAGAIVGTFATGWWLISALGVRGLVFTMGLLLVGLAVAVGRFWQQPALLGASLVLTAGAVAGLSARDALASSCTRETNYFCIKVYDQVRDGFPVRALVLDHLIHSYVKIGDPSYLGYEHEYVQAEITRYELARTGVPSVLQIGGGGYTYPRWVEAMLPRARVEVVEIDPGVTDVVHDQLGLPGDTRIVSYNLDGRQFVHELARKGTYALVVQDAVNDLSVPYHIMTKEYNDQVRALLAPGGLYLLTVIDQYQDGQLLRAAARTMLQTFPRVQLLSASRAWDSGGAAVWVIAGSEQGIDLDQMRQLLQAEGQGPMRSVALEPERLQAYLANGPQIVLTDQYAPVDNLIAPLFTRRN
jgi:spermidine synthase